jgi:hypothetical protein
MVITHTATGRDEDKPAILGRRQHPCRRGDRRHGLPVLAAPPGGRLRHRCPKITQLLDTRVVYLCPRLNPDGAELALADKPRYIRSSTRPYPFDEPPVEGLTVEDIDGDGRVLYMRIPTPTAAGRPTPTSRG